MRLTQDEHHRQLVQLHEETDEFYFIRLAVLFELNAAQMIETYNRARTLYCKQDAREIVLVSVRLVPYERFVECYVLCGTTRFLLPDTTGADSNAGSAHVAVNYSTTRLEKIGDGPASTAPSSTEKTD